MPYANQPPNGNPVDPCNNVGPCNNVPVEHWHDVIGDPTLADAILDRLVHNAHRLVLKRRKHAQDHRPARQT